MRIQTLFSFCIIGWCLALSGQVLAQAEQQRLDSLLDRISQQEHIEFSYEVEVVNSIFFPAFAKTWNDVEVLLEKYELQSRREANGVILIAHKVAIEKSEYLNNSLVILVHDESTNSPLEGALIQLSNQAGITNDNGSASFYASAKPASRSTDATVKVSYLGYVAQQHTVNFSLDTVRFAMQVDTMLIRTVEIIGRLPLKDIDVLISADQSNRVSQFKSVRLSSSSFNEVGFSAIAGVSRIDVQGFAPNIRGSQGNETRVEIDGLPLYHVDHLFGLFAGINPQAVADLEIFRSHYPADRGGSRGGLLDITSSKPVSNGIELSASQVSGAATVTAKKGAVGVLLSGRTSFGDIASGDAFTQSDPDQEDLLNARSLTSNGIPEFRYCDGYALLQIAPEESRWSLDLNGFRSQDKYNYQAIDVRQLGDRNFSPTLTGIYQENSSWRNLGFGVSLNYKLKDVRLQFAGHSTRYERDLFAGSDYTLEGRRQTRTRELFVNALDNSVQDDQVGIKLLPNAKDPQWEIGVQVQELETNADFTVGQRRSINEVENDTRIHLHGTYHLELSSTLTSTLALRTTYANANREVWTSPRLLLEKSVSSASLDNLKFNAGYSYTRQAVQSLQQENQFGQSYELLLLGLENSDEPAAAHNFSLGGSAERANLIVRAEAYYRKLPGVRASFSTTVGLDNDRVLISPQPTFLSAVGNGEVVGIDVDVNYQSDIWTASLAYTLSSSRQRFEAVDRNQWQRAPDDRRHRLATRQILNLDKLEFGLNYEAASGLVYNDIGALTMPRNRRTLAVSEVQAELDAYHRVDVNVGYSVDVKQVSVTAGLTLFNLFDRFNVSQRQYVVGIGQLANRGDAIAVGTDVGLLGRLLLAEISIKF